MRPRTLHTLIVLALIGAATLAALHFGAHSNDSQLHAQIDAAKLIEWSELAPPAKPVEDPLRDIPMNIRYDLGFIGKVQADADAHLISREGPEYRNAISLLDKHRAAGIEVDRLLAVITGRDKEIGERSEAINSELDGELVRLPGYALPLEMEKDGVTEFLLVPFVGACIHVPPPPPNQIVLAKLESAYEMKELYDPVLITGRLSAQPASSDLYLVDGQAQVPMGYSMQVVHVESAE